jgi:hypothetical protein
MFVAGKFINIFSVRNGFGVLYYMPHTRINLLFVMLVFVLNTSNGDIPVRVVLIRSIWEHEPGLVSSICRFSSSVSITGCLFKFAGHARAYASYFLS